MRRVNEFEVRPQNSEDRELLMELLDASAALWNEVTYERRQNFFESESIWNVKDYRERYKSVLGSGTAQQIIRKNESAWKSFLVLTEKWKTGDRSENPQPPGYWGNEDEGRELRTYIRNDQYTLEWSDRSRLEIAVGQQLKEEYGLSYHERLRLEVCGNPKWEGDQNRLELYYDEVSDTFRALQPVTVSDYQQDSPLASEEAALDVGANNLVACTTTTGRQYLYEGRNLFRRFHDITEEIAHYQSLLDDQRWTSKRIDRLYRRRTRQRNHAQDALVRNLVETLYNEGVSQVYVGELGNVLEAHWSCEVNEKTHLFWAFSRFIDRLKCVCEECGIKVVERSEENTTRACPECGERENTCRNGDDYRCDECGFEGHADLKASHVFLNRETAPIVGPMARPVRFQWDNHRWRPRESITIDSADTIRRRSTTDTRFRRTNPNEDRTDRSTHSVGKFAPMDSGTT